ncbi:AfsR/SARP family transcriptional regulator [Streptomyces sp. 4N509B]|uniref:AfsR/SARP family transcriptional regulator n=1 Tax=Streptomyces sp. 4N509B TaxID=3457413 RepID=UPI003FD4D741
MSEPDPRLRFALLGPVRAWRGEPDGEHGELALGSPQQRAVLATLLLRRKRHVTVGELVDAVWGEEPPSGARTVLRTYVSRLRKVLEPGRAAGEDPRVIVSVADGYAVHVADDALDVVVFERRVAEAMRLRDTDDLVRVGGLLHAALALCEGTPLAGIPGPLAENERTRLVEQRLNALELRLDVDIRLGHHVEVVGELASLTSEHPLREELCRLLMLALYRSGRQAEALDVYRRTRRTLVAELGIEPGPPLRELHARILAADPSLHPPASGRERPATDPTPLTAGSAPAAPAAPAWASPAPAAPTGRPEPATPPAAAQAPAPAPAPALTRPAQLPADLAVFTGRRAELAEAHALLPDDTDAPATVLITAIGGMAGIGKTALAVHWARQIAHRFPDGQLFVNLRGFDPTGSAVPVEDAVHSFLGALGVSPQEMPATLDAKVALYRSLLADRRVLILLDNARDTEQVRPLLPGSPGCMAIVTSRNQLTSLIANEGARSLTLNPMTLTEARDFLVRRLGAERLVTEPAAADEIIARCARLPLALAIITARLTTHPHFPLSAIVAELAESHGSLDVFAGGDMTSDVRAVFSLSHQALSAPAARLLRLLGLHPGPDFSAPVAASLAGLPVRQARTLLAELTSANLLSEYFPGRYTFHDLLRTYATELAESEESPEDREAAVERLLVWYLHTADEAGARITPSRQRLPLGPPPDALRPLTFATHHEALAWCEAERISLVAAVHLAAARAHTGTAWRLSSALWGFLYLRSHLHDWLDVARTSLTATRVAGDPLGEAESLLLVATALSELGRFDEAIDHYEQALPLYEALGNKQGLSKTLGNLGDAHLRAGRYEMSRRYTVRSLEADRASGNVWGESIALNNLGEAYIGLGRLDDAVEALREGLVVQRSTGNRWLEGVTLAHLGLAHHRLHRHTEALACYHQALEIHRELGNRLGEAHTLDTLAEVQLDVGDREAARASWRAALELLQRSDHHEAEVIRGRLGELEDPEHARSR